MKKLLLITFLLFSGLCYSQEKPTENNFKPIKIKLAVSGGCLIAGSIVNVIRTYQIEPTEFNNVNIDSYNQTQKDLHRISSMFYAFSGISLISICFNF